MKNKIRVGRLRRLAKHLRSKHRVHEKFNFGKLACGKLDEDGNYCGTAGCAIGEFPAVWPKEWEWNGEFTRYSYFNIVHKSQKKCETDYKVMAEFFSITEKQFGWLFEPYQSDVKLLGGIYLGEKATAEQVFTTI